MHSITTSFGRSFDMQKSESLLDATLRQAVVLDYSRRTGCCISLKERLVSTYMAAGQRYRIGHDAKGRGAAGSY